MAKDHRRISEEAAQAIFLLDEPTFLKEVVNRRRADSKIHMCDESTMNGPLSHSIPRIFIQYRNM